MAAGISIGASQNAPGPPTSSRDKGRPPAAAQLGEEKLTVHVTPWGPTQEQIDAVTSKLPRRGSLSKLLGKVRYRITDELASCAGPVLATINGRRWCFMLARGGLIGFEPKSGKVDFHFPWRAEDLASVNAANPVVVGDRVFISETYGPGSALVKVRPGGVATVWDDAKKGRDKSLQCHWNTPIYHDGYVYGCSGRYPNVAQRLDDLRELPVALGLR